MSNKDKIELLRANELRKALKPQLRFPEFQEEKSWTIELGGAVFDQVSNKEHNSDLPILAITQEHGAIPRDLIDYHVSVADTSLEGYKVVEPGDFIISLRSFQGGIEFSDYHGICSPAYVILRLKGKECAEYFRHYFKTDRFIGQMTKNLEGLRDGKMISYKQFSELTLEIPSHAEQKLIADCLSSLDALIAKEEEKLEKFKDYKIAIVQEIFPRKGEILPRLRFPDFQRMGGWETRALIELAENLDNRRIPITEKNRIKGDTPYYGASGIVDYVEGHIFDENLLCISEDGANLLARNTPIAFSISGKTWVNNHAHVLKFERNCIQIIVENYLNSISLEDYLTGMAQPKLNRTMLDTILVPISPIEEEQQAVANCLSSLSNLISAQIERISELKMHKKGLVQQLFPVYEEAPV